MEDNVLHYVHQDLPNNIWKASSPEQNKGYKEQIIKEVWYKHGKIKPLPAQEAKPSLFRILVSPLTEEKDDVSMLINLSPSKFEGVYKIP